MLDLFSGTGLVAAVYLEAGYQVTTLDSDPRWNADIQENILTWNYKEKFKPGHFHTITAAPPCTEFSQAKTTKARDLQLGDRLVEKTLEIIHYLRPIAGGLKTPGGDSSRPDPI